MLILTVGLVGLVLAPFLVLLAPLLGWFLAPMVAVSAVVVVRKLVGRRDPLLPLQPHHTVP